MISDRNLFLRKWKIMDVLASAGVQSILTWLSRVITMTDDTFLWNDKHLATAEPGSGPGNIPDISVSWHLTTRRWPSPGLSQCHAHSSAWRQSSATPKLVFIKETVYMTHSEFSSLNTWGIFEKEQPNKQWSTGSSVIPGLHQTSRCRKSLFMIVVNDQIFVRDKDNDDCGWDPT